MTPPPGPPATVPPPRDVTLPEPGSTTARDVLSRAIRRVLGDLMRLPPSMCRTPAGRKTATGLQARLRVAARTHPGALASLVRDPTAGALVRVLRELRDGEGDPAEIDGLYGELACVLGLGLARAGALDAPLVVAPAPARILSLTLRLALPLPEGTRVLTVAPDGRLAAETATGAVEVDPATATDPYHPVDPDTVLAVADNNPLAMFELHPDKTGNALDLGGRDPSEWTAVLREAFDLVEAHLPELREEMRLFVRQVVPVGFDAERHLSASYQEAIGTIYMTLHPQLMTMTEALIHEFSHNKLNALLELDPLLENAFHPLYKSPVRPDPRPLHGVLLAVHAFQPVARLYERMIEADHPRARSGDFLRRYQQILRTNREGAETVLGNGQPTTVGASVLDEIRRWDVHFAPSLQGEGGGTGASSSQP